MLKKKCKQPCRVTRAEFLIVTGLYLLVILPSKLLKLTDQIHYSVQNTRLTLFRKKKVKFEIILCSIYFLFAESQKPLFFKI